MRGKPRRALLLTGALGRLLVAGWASPKASAESSSESSAESKRTVSAGQIDKIAEATRKRFDEYQQVLKEIENQKVYNGVLQTHIDGQEAQIADHQILDRRVTIVERGFRR